MYAFFYIFMILVLNEVVPGVHEEVRSGSSYIAILNWNQELFTKNKARVVEVI